MNQYGVDFLKGLDWSNPQQATEAAYRAKQLNGWNDDEIAQGLNGAMGTNWGGSDIAAHFAKYGQTAPQIQQATLASEEAYRQAHPTPAPSYSGFSGIQGNGITPPTNLGLGAGAPSAMASTVPNGPAPTGYSPPAQLQPGQSQNLGMGGGMNFSQNPYLAGMADDIGRRSKFQLGQAFNGIRSNSIGVGGLGGSRQGVAEGVATGLANDAYQGNLANLYGTSWNADQNRNLAQYGMDQNFYTQQRGQDQTGAALGADLVTKGINNQWLPLQNANQIYGNYTGLGNTTTSQNTGGGANGVLGGVLAGGILGKNMGWWS